MLRGIAASRGIGLGRVMILEEHSLVFDEARATDVLVERGRFRQAVEAFCQGTAQQVEQLCRSAGYEDSRILWSHIEMVSDPELQRSVERLIAGGMCAEQAVQEVCNGYVEAFSGSHDELTRLRAADIRDMRRALLCVLLGVEEKGLRHVPKGTVLVAKELSPSMMSGIDRDNIMGIITETGGLLSHSSILARALGVPTVCGVAGIMEKLENGSFVIVDGSRGEVIRSPEQSVIEEYTRRRELFLAQYSRLECFRGRRTLSASGEEYELVCNITTPSGAAGAIKAGGEGVGLFRTEYLFMNRKNPPDEEEQTLAYTQTLVKAAGRPVVIRTLDVGGDKEVPCLGLEREGNPFLGLRGIRWCLAHRELFLTQLRALLRAGAGKPLRILLPMVSTMEELRESKAMLAKAAEQLTARGVPHADALPVGAMIETPGAALMAGRMAKEVDFFSMGTNDLTGYIMACDRGNVNVAGMYSPLQPALIRSMRHIIRSGVEAGIPVGICGEAASDPRLAPVLMSFGITGFSVSAGSVLEVRKTISEWTKAEADQVTQTVLEMDTEPEIEAYLSGCVREKSGTELEA